MDDVDEADQKFTTDTLMRSLWQRTHEAERSRSSGFDDPFAREMLERSGLDLDRPPTDRDPRGRSPVERTTTTGALQRTIIFDDLARRFVERHGRRATIVSVGCGLCTREKRLGPELGSDVRWIGIDSPTALAARAAVIDDDPLELVPGRADRPDWAATLDLRDRPTLALAEGLLMYLDPAGLCRFLEGAATLPRGSEIAADVVHERITTTAPSSDSGGCCLRSGVHNGSTLTRLAPGLELIAEHDVMERVGCPQRIAAKTFHDTSNGGRLYHVAHLRVR